MPTTTPSLTLLPRGSRGIICHETTWLALAVQWFPIRSRFEPTVYYARLSRYGATKILGSWPWFLWSRDVIGHVINIWFPYVVHWNQSDISHGCWDACVKNLAKQFLLKMHWSQFYVSGGKIGGYSIFQLWAYSDTRDTSCEPLTATIGPRASL